MIEEYPDIEKTKEKSQKKKKYSKSQIVKMMSDFNLKIKNKCPKCGENNSIVKDNNIVIKEAIPNEDILIGNLRGSVCEKCGAIFLDEKSYKIASSIINEEIKESMEMTKTNITLRKYQYEWIKKHKSFNFSGFVQESIDKLIKRDKKTEMPYISEG